MCVDIRLARSLEQILRSQLMKGPRDVFEAEGGKKNAFKSPVTTAKKFPLHNQQYRIVTHTYACVQNTQTHYLDSLKQILWA